MASSPTSTRQRVALDSTRAVAAALLLRVRRRRLLTQHSLPGRLVGDLGGLAPADRAPAYYKPPTPIETKRVWHARHICNDGAPVADPSVSNGCSKPISRKARRPVCLSPLPEP